MSAPVAGVIGEPTDPRLRRLLDRYAAAFERADAAALTRVLRADAVLELPPSPAWYAGRDQIGRFLAAGFLGRPGDFALVRVAANGDPGFAVYRRDADGGQRAYALQVLTLDPGGIARVVSFQQPELFGLFGLPAAVPSPAPPGPPSPAPPGTATPPAPGPPSPAPSGTPAPPASGTSAPPASDTPATRL